MVSFFIYILLVLYYYSENLKRVIFINVYLVPRRITRNLRLKQVVVDDEEDDDEDNTNADEKVDQKEAQTNVSSQSNDSKQEEKKNINITETNDSRPRTRRAVAEASDKSNDHVNEQGDDLYTRIKRSRRKIQTKPNSKYNFYYNH